MANELTNSTVISKANSGFPSYLDFDDLRSASIEYLSKLTGKVWTDYNVHDPGITILEMLIYALLDLGYRTNLPAIDIFTKNPADNTPEDNFFKPAQILSCNPLTTTDFRKLLIDIDGVKNAWLTVADDINVDSICVQNENTGINKSNEAVDCKSYINGLYHICIEKDDSIVTKDDESGLVNKIKAALQARRNLCEDFIDITFLCPLEIGVCADISLDANADADEVYRSIVIALKEFFSPSPVFYTLQQLLDRQMPIEAIYAGRPCNYTQSHGFVDTAEFEAITLKKEIHLSDVYNIILGVTGVKTVKRLKLKKNHGSFSSNWQFRLPDNYTPVFSTTLSSFNFTLNGLYQPVDINKSEAYLQLASANSAKLIQLPGQLDLEIPKSVYHNDLADYYSIQNEFPLVYGIGEGGLPDSASPQRKAQALQLKAYLLFFDQLFADYLAQLKNIRSVFSFTQSSTENKQTYFLSGLNDNGGLDTVPDFSKLVINIANKKGESDAGNNGTILAWPVWKKDMDILLQQESFSSADIKNLQQQFKCSTKDQCDIITALLQNDFSNNLYQPPAFVNTSDNLSCGYISFSDEDVVLASEFFPDKQAADKAIQLLINVAQLPECYKSYPDGNSFVFNVQLNFPVYAQFLQQITEDKDLYNTRRDAFLNHLLSRFAEQFSDYAMLSYGFSQGDDLAGEIIKSKESFLSQYPLLSSQRGKAFDYSTTSSNNAGNTSGFEQRFKAYTGIASNTNSLCNFEVAEYKDAYSVQLKIAGFHLFDTSKSYEGLNKAQAAAQSIFKSAADASAYHIKQLPYEGKYQLQVLYNNNETAYYTSLFDNAEDADNVSVNMQRMFSNNIADEDIIVSGYEYRLQLKNSDNVIRLSANAFANADEAFAAAIGILGVPSDTANWQIIAPDQNPSGKFCSNSKKKPERLVDTDYFKIDVNNNIVGKPDKYSYELLDKENTFKIRTLNEFNNPNQARTDCYRLLLLMTDINNYQLTRENRRNRMYIIDKGKPVAECVNRLESEAKTKDFRDKIYAIIQAHYYTLSAEAFPNRWKFTYTLGFEKNRKLLFESDNEFNSKEAAMQAAENFNASLANVNLEVINDKYTLKISGDDQSALTCISAGDEIVKEGNEEKLAEAKSFLALRQQVNKHIQSGEKEPFNDGIEIDEISRQGKYVYRLVDKDNLVAQHLVAGEADAKEILDDLYNTFVAGYNILGICLGGDITVTYIDSKTQAVSYRYVIKCNNFFGLFKPGSVLFESVQAYSSVEQAEAAFTSNYIQIVTYATDLNNYGEGKYISLDENISSNSGNATLVFIPKETQEIITGSNADVITTMVQVAKSYPIKTVLKCSDGFAELFPSVICDNDGKYVYYFSVYNSAQDIYDWQSVKPYDTLVDARKDFSFFMMLLLYKGNYYIHADFCNKQTIYVREVLAESNARFGDADVVWDENGIEKFVCVAQSDNAFSSRFNNDKCAYDFNVVCNSANAVHACKYNTAAKRDEVIDALYKSFKAFDTSKLFKIINDGNNQWLYGMDGNTVAALVDRSSEVTDCKRIAELLTSAADDSNYKDIEGKVSLWRKNDDQTYTELAKPGNDSVTKSEWKKQLLGLAYYYPVKEKQNKYCIEIRIPGFNTEKDNKPCGCSNENFDNEDDCYLAWQSACCFNTCDEAITKYDEIQKALVNYENYYAYFDCECYAYGISLLARQDIIAHNPQQYTTPDMVCDAIERSKYLLNSEGLRVVEHILLRPRCENDCSCEPPGFNNPTNCDGLTWVTEVIENGQTINNDICFVPGSDPYSFIATVVLPAWPQRFRKKENRDLLEAILNREIPSHILLRILWLKPKDVCDFETLHNEWRLWLAQSKDCDRSDVLCSFKNFLFKNGFDCLSDCKDCRPCTETISQTSCDDDLTEAKSSDSYQRLGYINQLFGWEEFSCTSIATNEPGREQNITVADAPQIQSPGAVKAVPDYKEMTAEEYELHTKKTRFVNGRLARYKKSITHIYDDTNNNPLAEKALRVGDANLAEKINSIVGEILSNKKAVAKKQVLSQSQKDDLCKNLIWLYIDKILFSENDVSKLNLIEDALNKLRQNNFDMQLLFTEWEPAKFAKYETPGNIEAVRKAILNV